MSIWVLPAVLIIGIIALASLGLHLANDLKESDEHMEHIE